MDISIVVASHANPQGCYLTVFALLQQMQNAGLQYEIIIAADGGTETKFESLPNVRCLRLTGDRRTGSPQGTRDAGIRAALARNVLCVEDHVVINNIIALYAEHVRLGGAMTFCARVGETTEMISSVGYVMDWDKRFWQKHPIYTCPSKQPFRVVGFGHAAFMIDRDFYIKSGGYFLEMRGWGGEEPDLNLLVWQLGREIWMVPSVTHAHYLTPGAHGDVTSSPDFARNFCIAAYEHGGEEYLQKVESHFGYKLQRNAAIELRRQKICAGRFAGNLSSMRQFLKQEKIAGADV
jgi:hypothetical protein